MNTLESFKITNPFGNEEECAKFVIDNLIDKFVFHDITNLNQEYTFSCWLKSDAEGSVEIGGKTFASSATWKKCVATFTAESVDFMFRFLSEGTYYFYNSQLEIGNQATDWRNAPEDAETKITTLTTQYSDIRKDVDGITAIVASHTTKIEQKADGSTVKTIQTNLSLLEQDFNGFKSTVSDTYVRQDVYGEEIQEVRSVATQTADKFNWMVESGGSATNFTLTDRMIEATAEKFVVKSSTGATIIEGGTMKLDELFAQEITATNLTIKGNSSFEGKLVSTSGTIGGWTIANGKIYAGDEETGVAAMQYPRANVSWVFAAGGTSHDSYANCPFRVKKSGELYATKATIEGQITATSGKIGSWDITSDGILASAYKNTADNKWYGVGLDPRSDMFNLAKHNDGNGGRVFAFGHLGSGSESSASAAINGSWGNAALQVFANGKLVANNIEANGGKIGGWNIGTKVLYQPNYGTSNVWYSGSCLYLGELNGASISSFTYYSSGTTSIIYNISFIALTPRGVYFQYTTSVSGTRVTQAIDWFNIKAGS